MDVPLPLKVIAIITPFTSTLTNGELISQVYTLFFSEIITINVFQLLDPLGHIERHILAPRAATQDAMNVKMQGQVFELAERYTSMTKMYVENCSCVVLWLGPWLFKIADVCLFPFQFVSCFMVLRCLSWCTLLVLFCTFHQLFRGSLLVDAHVEASTAAWCKDKRVQPTVFFLFSNCRNGHYELILLGRLPFR